MDGLICIVVMQKVGDHWGRASSSSLFFKFLHFFFLLEYGYIFAFKSFLDFLSETLNSSIE